MCRVIAWDGQISLWVCMCVMQCVLGSDLCSLYLCISPRSSDQCCPLLCTRHPSLKADPCVRARARAANIYYESSQRSGQSVSVSGVTSDSKDLPTPGHPVTIECWLTQHQSLITVTEMTLGLTVTLLATGLSLATAETVLGDICKYGILSNGHRYLEVVNLKFYAEKETRNTPIQASGNSHKMSYIYSLSLFN